MKPEGTRGTIVCDDLTAGAINTQSLSTRTLNVSSMMVISSLGVDKSVQIFGNGIKGDAVSILNGNMSIQEGSLSVNGDVTIVSSNQNASNVSISDGQINASLVPAPYISCLTQEKTGYCRTDNLVASDATINNATITNATISESINLPKKDKIKIDSSDFESEITRIVKSVITSEFADELNKNIAIVRNLITSRFSAELQANIISVQDIILTYLKGRLRMCCLFYKHSVPTVIKEYAGSVFEECDEYYICESGFSEDIAKSLEDYRSFLQTSSGGYLSGRWVALSMFVVDKDSQFSTPFLAIREN